MSGVDSTSESALIGDPGDIEIKIEYPEINTEPESENNSSLVGSATGHQHQPTIHDTVYSLWTSKATNCLINQYKKYRSMVGQTTQFKSLRDMFEIISIEMQKHGFFFSPQKCENKWRVLERKYKNLLLREMMKKPGRMKHYGHWEHKRALDEIFNEKRKSVYLHESEYPPVGGSTKYALILPKPISQQNTVSPVNATLKKLKKPIGASKDSPIIEMSEDLLATTSSTTGTTYPSNELISTYFEKFLAEMKKLFETAERNKERRHMVKIGIRENELKVQQRLLKLKEQKLELKKRKLLAMAQSIHLNL